MWKGPISITRRLIKEGREITLWDDKLKKGKKVAREKFEIKLDDNLN